jgi:methyltransferase
VTPAYLLLSAVTVERLAELLWDRRNTAMLLAAGASEFSPRHYPAIVLLHMFWLVALWLLGWDRPLGAAWLTLFMALQFLRVWILVTLKGRWTTRIIILPTAPLVTRGPYRFLSHPNYLVVVGEIAVLPLCLGLPWLALVFSTANALILTIRVRAENAALQGSRYVDCA